MALLLPTRFQLKNALTGPECGVERSSASKTATADLAAVGEKPSSASQVPPCDTDSGGRKRGTAGHEGVVGSGVLGQVPNSLLLRLENPREDPEVKAEVAVENEDEVAPTLLGLLLEMRRLESRSSRKSSKSDIVEKQFCVVSLARTRFPAVAIAKVVGLTMTAVSRRVAFPLLETSGCFASRPATGGLLVEKSDIYRPRKN